MCTLSNNLKHSPMKKLYPTTYTPTVILPWWKMVSGCGVFDTNDIDGVSNKLKCKQMIYIRSQT